MGPIFIKIGQKLLQTFGYSDYVFQFLGYFLYSVDSLKCVDAKTTPSFESSIILSGFNWLRSKNGTIFYQNGTNIIVNFWSL